MTTQHTQFRVAALHASVPEGVPIEWMGNRFGSGPLMLELDEGPDVEASRGELDYARRHAQAEFHVRVRMPELTDLLETLGMDPDLSRTVYATVRSQGTILPDHSLNLVGTCRIKPHKLFDGAQVRLLAGH